LAALSAIDIAKLNDTPSVNSKAKRPDGFLDFMVTTQDSIQPKRNGISFMDFPIYPTTFDRRLERQKSYFKIKNTNQHEIRTQRTKKNTEKLDQI